MVTPPGALLIVGKPQRNRVAIARHNRAWVPSSNTSAETPKVARGRRPAQLVMCAFNLDEAHDAFFKQQVRSTDRLFFLSRWQQVHKRYRETFN